jgi:hypothetical protein
VNETTGTELLIPPSNNIFVAELNPVPFIVNKVPAGPDVGVIDVITGYALLTTDPVTNTDVLVTALKPVEFLTVNLGVYVPELAYT